MNQPVSTRAMELENLINAAQRLLSAIEKKELHLSINDSQALSQIVQQLHEAVIKLYKQMLSKKEEK